MTDKETLAWELDYHARHDTDLAAALAFERARSEAIRRGYIRMLETLLAALAKPPVPEEVRHDS
jgi:hypothetical protein